MPKFSDKKIYYSSLDSRSNGVYLVSDTYEELLDFEKLQYILSTCSIHQLHITNQFRKVEYPDGSYELLLKDNSSYKEAQKKERIKLKDLECGEILVDKYGSRYIYIGTYYKAGENKKTHYFYYDSLGYTMYIRTYTSLTKFIDVDGFEQKYRSLEKNLSSILAGHNLSLTKH